MTDRKDREQESITGMGEVTAIDKGRGVGRGAREYSEEG